MSYLIDSSVTAKNTKVTLFVLLLWIKRDANRKRDAKRDGRKVVCHGVKSFIYKQLMAVRDSCACNMLLN